MEYTYDGTKPAEERLVSVKINGIPIDPTATYSVTANEINDFLTTFFKLYPTATQKELSYYVTDGILKPIGKDYVFQELVNREQMFFCFFNKLFV